MQLSANDNHIYQLKCKVQNVSFKNAMFKTPTMFVHNCLDIDIQCSNKCSAEKFSAILS